MNDLMSLVEAQTKSMTELHLKVKWLTADAAMYKERMEYWKERCLAYHCRLIETGDLPTDDSVKTCDINLIPIAPADHPLFRDYVWTIEEMSWITEYAKRCVLANYPNTKKTDDALENLRAHGLEDHLTGSDQDA